MDNMDGMEVPENLPPIKYIDISNEEYQKIMDLFQPKRSKREDIPIRTNVYRPDGSFDTGPVHDWGKLWNDAVL
jgi:hypothetical protein